MVSSGRLYPMIWCFYTTLASKRSWQSTRGCGA